MNVTDPRWDGTAEVFKVFTFRKPGDAAAPLQDCTGRDGALAYLAAEPTPGNTVVSARGAGADGSARVPRTAA
jgi:hypothetical protein